MLNHFSERLANMDRRQFSGLVSAAWATSLSGSLAAASMPRKPRILLRSSWQTINIGDIAHTPGVMALIEKYLPDVELRLWPVRVENGVEEMLRARFPKVELVLGKAAQENAFEESDFLLHGSGPSLVAQRDVEKWRESTGKPYGVYGITFSKQESSATQPALAETLAKTIEVLSGAKFVFFRDSVSMSLAKSLGCTCPIMEFGPDGAFAVDLANDARADKFLSQNGLERGQFLCCIPRLRFTPYWTIPEKKLAIDEKKHSRNEAMKEQDCKPLRDAILSVIETTSLKVLLCPEDKTQMAVGREMIFDRLPESARSRVVWRESYWLTDEAISTYRRSAGLFGHEMHSPIMCIGNGIPALVCRWAEQTSKGFMWQDIGLGDWLFDFDQEEDRRRLPAAVLDLATNPAEAATRVAKAQSFVQQRQKETMSRLSEIVRH